MLGVNVAACLAGQCLCRSPQPFFPTALQRFKVCRPAKQVEYRPLVPAFCSPAGTCRLRFRPGRVIAPGLTLRLPRSASFEPVRLLAPSLVRFRFGAVHSSKPVARALQTVPRIRFFRRSPSGLSSLGIGLPCGWLSRPAEALTRRLTVKQRPISHRSPPASF